MNTQPDIKDLQWQDRYPYTELPPSKRPRSVRECQKARKAAKSEAVHAALALELRHG